MKRFLCCIMVLALLALSFPVNVSALESEKEIIHFDDGSYAVVDVITYHMRATGTISGNKPYTYYNSDGVAQWKAVLSGTFSVSNSGATCTASSMNVTIYDSSWYTVSKSATKSGNTANGSTTVGRKVAGVTVVKIPVSLTLSCDRNGNLS